MNKVQILGCLVLLLCKVAVAQHTGAEWLWAKSMGGVDGETVTDMVSDGQGSVYVCGTFRSNELVLGAQQKYIKPTGLSEHVYLASYNGIGFVNWSLAITGRNGFGVRINDMEVDNEGNIWVVGWFKGEFMLVGTKRVDNLGGYNEWLPDGFVAKIDKRGGVLWAKALGSVGTDELLEVSPNRFGEVYVVLKGFMPLAEGNSEKLTVTINPATARLYLLKLDAGGELGWMKYYEFSTNIGFVGIAADKEGGGVYVGGWFKGRDLLLSEVDLHQINDVPQDGHFVMKYDTEGTREWLHVPWTNSTVSLWGLQSDVQGNVLLVGSMGSRQEHSTDILAEWNKYPIPSAEGENSYILKMSPAGSVLWATTWGSTVGYDVYTHLRTDQAGNAYVLGHSGAEAVFGSFRNPLEDDFILTIAPNGTIQNYYTDFDGDMGIIQPFRMKCIDLLDSTSVVVAGDFTTEYHRIGKFELSNKGKINNTTDVFIACMKK